MTACGVLPVDKAAGRPSAREVAAARRLFGGVKAGHAGTLDPEATGVLPVMLGEATAFARFFTDPKTYRAEIIFGATTETDDGEGAVLCRRTPPSDLGDALRAALPSFTGLIEQTAPAYSALKHNGKPMYYYARNNIPAPQKRRQVRVHSLRLCSATSPRAVLEVRCGGGFYVRALARDLGGVLGCGAYLGALRRTECASFSAAESVSLDGLAALPEAERMRHIAPLSRALAHLPECGVCPETARELGCGGGITAAAEDGEQVRFSANGRFAGVGLRGNGQFSPQKMLSWTRTQEARAS
ncbi:MAG: tRNA pseudouridine(55) synthase TruB [Gammaproteobacteria bacterium]